MTPEVARVVVSEEYRKDGLPLHRLGLRAGRMFFAVTDKLSAVPRHAADGTVCQRITVDQLLHMCNSLPQNSPPS